MDYVGAIDQGTSSTRFLIFNTKTWKIVSSHQIEINQVFPHPGWVEIDPYEISTSVTKCIEVALKKLNEISGDNVASQLRAVGITNQRETTILWDKESGKPLYNAIVWLDNRTAKTAELLIKTIPGKDADYFKKITGLPIHPYFSALKIRWLLENVEAVRRAKDKGTLMFGNVDSWIVWNLTGKHVTDVTNASRTLLFDLEKAEWSSEMCDFFGIPMSILPEVHSSAENYGQIISSALKDVPVTGILGDQQASLVGHFCLKPGDIKNTYGTGTFMLCNVGTKPIFSNDGLLSTIAFQLGKNKQICYALEGSGSIGGNVIRFLRDNLNFYEASDCEKLAKSVKDCGGVVFVPCFTGLFSPYWDASARGALFGVTQYTNKAHITRAALEAVCYQSADLLDAVSKSLPTDCRIKALKVHF
uniref:Probable glycerol kinase n=1 Tax=Syphacia muris TaxID=451379 RepID=A0A0N5AME3_9BILA